MQPGGVIGAAETEALLLLRRLRQIDAQTGIKNSRIAFDVALLFYEIGLRGSGRVLTVDQMADMSGYSGPTIRLVLKRMIASGDLAADGRLGKTQLYTNR